MAKKIRRPNRRLSVPRELYDVLANIAYWQSPAISTNDFVIELLMMLSYEYGKMMKDDVELAKDTMKLLMQKTNFMHDPDNNNRFQDVRI